ncbi:MAG TPA: hypothetical protein VIO11_09000, partial [Candidatus Methanoperedens sp.]
IFILSLLAADATKPVFPKLIIGLLQSYLNLSNLKIIIIYNIIYISGIFYKIRTNVKFAPSVIG